MKLSTLLLIVAVWAPGAPQLFGAPPTATSSEIDASKKAEAQELIDQARLAYADDPTRADEVINLLTRALDLDPENHDATARLAIMYYRTERFDLAATWFDKATHLDREKGTLNSRLYMMKARLLFGAGKFRECRQVLIAGSAFLANSSDESFADQYERLKKEVDKQVGSILVPAATAARNDVISLKIDPQPYMFVVVDQQTHPFVLEDPEIAPYVTPEATKNDWWIVILIAKSAGVDGGLGIYLDKSDLTIKDRKINGEPPKAPEEQITFDRWVTHLIYAEKGGIPIISFELPIF